MKCPLPLLVPATPLLGWDEKDLLPEDDSRLGADRVVDGEKAPRRPYNRAFRPGPATGTARMPRRRDRPEPGKLNKAGVWSEITQPKNPRQQQTWQYVRVWQGPLSPHVVGRDTGSPGVPSLVMYHPYRGKARPALLCSSPLAAEGVTRMFTPARRCPGCGAPCTGKYCAPKGKCAGKMRQKRWRLAHPKAKLKAKLKRRSR
jgi:hypothetical protein